MRLFETERARRTRITLCNKTQFTRLDCLKSFRTDFFIGSKYSAVFNAVQENNIKKRACQYATLIFAIFGDRARGDGVELVLTAFTQAIKLEQMAFDLEAKAFTQFLRHLFGGTLIKIDHNATRGANEVVVSAFGAEIPGEITECAERASFSAHETGQNELDICRALLRDMTAGAYSSLGACRKLVFKYLKGLI